MSVQLVITIAYKPELPFDWLKEVGIPVYPFGAIQKGKVTKDQIEQAGQEPIIVWTGFGLKSAKKAALWIEENLEPLVVLNLGMAGSLDRSLPLRQWVSPTFVGDEQGERCELDTRMPVALPKEISVQKTGGLISVREPVFGETPPSWEAFDCVDMEAFALAKVFRKSSCSFHVIKWLSDYSGKEGKAQFFDNIGAFQSDLKKVLGFRTDVLEPDISVVIPVFNRADRIKRCVESVLSQTLPPREILVVDDGSADQTSQILEQYGSRITVISLERNQGVSAARNIGVEQARGEWIAFLDSDDRWKPEKLARQWAFLRRHPFYQIIQSEEIWYRNEVRVNRCKHHEKPQGWIWQPSLERCLITPSAVLMKKTLFDGVGGFDRAFPVCEDYDLWLRLSRNHLVGLDPSPSVVKYGGHADQLSQKYTAMDRYRVLALLKALAGEGEEAHQKAINGALSERLNILKAGSYKRGRKDRVLAYEELLSRVNIGAVGPVQAKEIIDGNPVFAFGAVEG